MSAPAAAQKAPVNEHSLYAEHKKIYPRRVQGTFRRIKWGILVVSLTIYYFLPFVRWDRGPNAPDQAVLIDFPNRRFYFFFIEIWPQEVYYFTGLLILAALILFLVNAVAGRVWCGYLCPQTVWTDLYLAVERWVEGNWRDRRILDEGPWTLGKVRKKTTKHFLWLMIAWWTGGVWVLYFADAPTLVYELATFQAPMTAWMWIGILTFTTYLLAGFAREQVCIYMCPWPRIQAALIDDEALNVTYRTDRGEPRGSVKRQQALAAEGKPVGDCIDCYQCQAVCPTGVDIRNGLQLECIQCGLCIDACDNIMTKIGRPTGLIGYDTDKNIERRKRSEAPRIRLIRPRTILYSAIIAVVGGLMLAQLLTRSDFGLSVLHDRNPLFVRLSDGGLRNGYTVRFLNKQRDIRRFTLHVTGLNGLSLKLVGVETQVAGRPVVEVEPDTTREVRALVFLAAGQPQPASRPIEFVLTDLETGQTKSASDFFKGPGQ